MATHWFTLGGSNIPSIYFSTDDFPGKASAETFAVAIGRDIFVDST